ncbi:MAG TPA: cupin domain-containing protein [Gaiellaceae bacterium]|nr:cupin domain-containing protein [Gaiellaceae bacterium]
MSTFDNAGSIPPQPIWNGLVSRSVSGEQLTLALIELEPNADVPEHSHENEQVGFLIEGAMRFTIGGETAEVRPGGSWRILSGVPHSVVAGPEGAVAVEAFSPPRHDWAAIPAAEPGPGRWP